MTTRIDTGTAASTQVSFDSASSVDPSSNQVASSMPGEWSVLPDPVQQMASSGDLLAELVALLTLVSRSDRDAARSMQRAEEVARTQAEQQKIAKMHDEADHTRASAWASGLADIGQGICEVGGAFSTSVPDEFDWSNGFKAMSSGAKAGGELASGQYEWLKKRDAADAENEGFKADRAGRGSKQATDDLDDARELLGKVVSFYEQMLQAQTSAQNTAASMRA